MRKYIFVFILLLISSQVWPATLYVKQSASGTGDGSSCANADDLATVQGTVDDDDIVILCDDTYTTALNPTNSGSSGHPITFQADSTGAYLENSTAAINLTAGQDYITIDGVKSDNSKTRILDASNADYIIIKNGHFTAYTNTWANMRVGTGCDHWEFDTNTFDVATGGMGSGSGTMLQFLNDAGYHYIHDNTFVNGLEHDFLQLNNSDYNLVKDNTFYSDGTFATEYTGGSCVNGPAEIVQIMYGADYNVFEENTFYETGGSVEDQCGKGFHIVRSKYNIFRRNVGYNMDESFWDAYADAYGDTINNRAYNNSTYNTEYDPRSTIAATFYYQNYQNNDTADNIVKNNIVSTVTSNYAFGLDASTGSTYTYGNIFDGNWLYNITQEDVRKYVDSVLTKGSISTLETAFPTEFMNNSADDSTDPKLTDPANGDMTLASDSPCIDAGEWLTTITSATGSGATFTVADPYFFFGGNSGVSLAGDTIKTQNGQTATITNINYVDGIITVSDPSFSWVQNEGVALDYNGNAPDIGAEEYGGTPPVPAANFSPANGASGVAVTTHLTFDAEAGETFDIYLDKVDCTTLTCDDNATGDCDPGTLDTTSTYYWKVHANTANQDFPETGCFTFSTVSPSASKMSFGASSGGFTVDACPSGGTCLNIEP